MQNYVQKQFKQKDIHTENIDQNFLYFNGYFGEILAPILELTVNVSIHSLLFALNVSFINLYRHIIRWYHCHTTHIKHRAVSVN